MWRRRDLRCRWDVYVRHRRSGFHRDHGAGVNKTGYDTEQYAPIVHSTGNDPFGWANLREGPGSRPLVRLLSNWVIIYQSDRRGHRSQLDSPRRSANDADQVVWIWAGIGGVATEGNALVQDGVRGSCTSGTQKWSAVLESNPHVYTTVQTLPVAINSRDSVSFTVTVVGSQATYTVSDLTSGQSASVTQRVPTVVPEHSGECVVEPPLEPTGAVSPLPDFGTVTISGCSVTTSLGAVCPVPLGTGCPDGTTYTRVEMATSNNASTVLAKVPVPPRGAKTFQVLWDAYCNPSPECMLG